MMLPTHALAGIVLAIPLAALEPELATVALAAGFLGGVFPDLDLYVGHRKTLHYPGYYTLLSAPAAAVALLAPSPATVGVAGFAIGAAAHSLSDVLGGGLELRPWENTSERAVYDHVRGRWIRPRRWIRYDGAPEDLLLSVGLAAPLLAGFGGPIELGGPIESVVAATPSVAVGYAAVRRWLPEVAARLAPAVPAAVRPYVPKRYFEATNERSVETAREPAAEASSD